MIATTLREVAEFVLPMVIIQRVALEHRCLFLLQLYCSVSSHNAMTMLISTKVFEIVNAVPEDYGDADCGITLARSTLTFFPPAYSRELIWACAPGLHPRSNITRLFLISTAKPSTLGAR